jgi:hypothetical protein
MACAISYGVLENERVNIRRKTAEFLKTEESLIIGVEALPKALKQDRKHLRDC